MKDQSWALLSSHLIWNGLESLNPFLKIPYIFAKCQEIAHETETFEQPASEKAHLLVSLVYSVIVDEKQFIYW